MIAQTIVYNLLWNNITFLSKNSVVVKTHVYDRSILSEAAACGLYHHLQAPVFFLCSLIHWSWPAMG